MTEVNDFIVKGKSGLDIEKATAKLNESAGDHSRKTALISRVKASWKFHKSPMSLPRETSLSFSPTKGEVPPDTSPCSTVRTGFQILFNVTCGVGQATALINLTT